MKQTIQPFQVTIEGKSVIVYANYPGVAISRAMQYSAITNPGQDEIPFKFWDRSLSPGEELVVRVTRLAANVESE